VKDKRSWPENVHVPLQSLLNRNNMTFQLSYCFIQVLPE